MNALRARGALYTRICILAYLQKKASKKLALGGESL
jgi:hypothetical protein